MGEREGWGVIPLGESTTRFLSSVVIVADLLTEMKTVVRGGGEGDSKYWEKDLEFIYQHSLGASAGHGAG